MAKNRIASKTCTECSQAFAPRSNNVTYCDPCLTKTCLQCGEQYRVHPRSLSTNRFCSRPCAARHQMRGNKHAVGNQSPSQFPKGHAPWNKDLKGIHLSPESEFTAGMAPLNKLPIGTVRTRTRHKRGGQQRRWVKVAEPNRWRLCAHVVWEKANGDIPPGHIIHHRDHDSLNDRIENLECLSRADHLREHNPRDW